jgi:aminoglycoside N3'-acetyltransferase
MLEVDSQQVIAVLLALNLQAGDSLLVHSAIQYLGRPVGGVAMYLEALQTVIGPHGNIAVPAFNFAFARGEVDARRWLPLETPSQGMGAFSEYVRQQPEARRSLHPMQSLAVIGPSAADLAERDTLSAFDHGSAFERLLELDFKLLLLGANVQAVAMIHYSEQRAGVPYRTWKDFQGQVHTGTGWETRTYRMFARDLQADPRLDLRPLQTELQARGEWAEIPLNYGQVSTCRLCDFVAAADRLLAADPWAFVINREEIKITSDADDRKEHDSR